MDFAQLHYLQWRLDITLIHICYFAVVDLYGKTNIFRNCSYFLGNHKLTTTAKVIIKICEHEVSKAMKMKKKKINENEFGDSFFFCLLDE